MKEPIKINASGGQAFVNSEFSADQMNFEETNHYHNVSKSNFSKIKFDHDSDLPYPIFTREVEDKLIEQRIVIIASHGLFDQTYFGRQLIKKIHNRNEDIVPSELIQNEDNTGLIKQIEALDNGQAILFNEIHPTHLSYDFQKFADLAISRNSYYIITTELSVDVWAKCVGFKSEYYFEVFEENHYQQKELEGWFLKEIESNLPLYLQDANSISLAINISETLTIADLIETLPNPLRLKSLLDYLHNKEKIPSDKNLIKEIQHLKSSDLEYITRWFNNLSHNQKILAITAALCDGIFHDQYFELMELLCREEFWKSSCPELTSIDFHQLIFLPKRADETRFREGILLMSYYNSFRSVVAQLAMQEYPRHLESLFRGLTEVTKTTFSSNKYDNWKLYGTSLKVGVLRHVFIEASKDINAHDFSFIESVYLEMASDKNAKIQDLAAKSVAKLRELGRDDFLFSIIDSWLNNHEIKMQVYLYLKRINVGEEAPRNPISYLKSTIIRILAYAASYDQPNQLHDKIIEYLFELVEEKDWYIQDSLVSMLPKFIHHNIHKLKSCLDDLMKKQNLGHGISIGLAHSYKDYPGETKSVLDDWFALLAIKIKGQERRKSLTQAETKLIALIKTLQKIELNPSSYEGFSAEEIYSKIADFLTNHTKEPIKREVVSLISSIQLQNFDEGLKYSQVTLSKLTTTEQKSIVKNWTRAYIKERSDLEIGNADLILNMGNKDYPIWIDKSKRPLTLVEKKMMLWLNSNKAVAQKYATLTFLSMAKEFDQNEEETIQRWHKMEEEKEKLRLADLDLEPMQFTNLPVKNSHLGFWLRVKIFLYSIFESRAHRAALKEITKLLVNTGGYSRNDLRLVIEKWKLNAEDNELAQKLAKWLDRLF